MQDLADAGADSAAGGLFDSAGDITNTDGLPDFFQTGGGGGGGGNRGGLDSPSNLFDPLADFDLGKEAGPGQGNGDAGNALLASLGLPVAGAGGEGQGTGAAVAAASSVGGADQSEWALMQKQFEDMNKSFLQE